jgi:FMN reductase
LTKLVAVLGSVTPPGRLQSAVVAALLAARELDASVESELVDLVQYRIGFADGRPIDQMGDDTPAVVQRVSTADALLIATPVYRGSMTGALKNLLDLLPVEALQNKVCGLIAMGATQHHYLGADRHLRDVLAWFGALVAPTSVYLTAGDFKDGTFSESGRTDLRALVQTVLTLERALRGEPSLGPPPLASRYT